MKTALVLGAGGFIGHHLVRRLKSEGCWVRGVDLQDPWKCANYIDEFYHYDLRDMGDTSKAFIHLVGPSAYEQPFDEVYQLAADMGGAGYIFTGEHDCDILTNSLAINRNVVLAASLTNVGKLFFSSSACIYPQQNQDDPLKNTTEESTAYPANPDSEYGWEKLIAERLYLSYARQHGLDVRIGRYHNVFGPECAWNDGREKVPAAICRKVAVAANPGLIEVWGDGRQTRSFLYIDECITATLRLMRHPTFRGPVNIGSDHAISINDLVRMVADIAHKKIAIDNVPGPQGVRGRVSDNRLIQRELGFVPAGHPLLGLRKLYPWVEDQVARLAEAQYAAPP